MQAEIETEHGVLSFWADYLVRAMVIENMETRQLPRPRHLPFCGHGGRGLGNAFRCCARCRSNWSDPENLMRPTTRENRSKEKTEKLKKSRCKRGDLGASDWRRGATVVSLATSLQGLPNLSFLMFSIRLSLQGFQVHASSVRQRHEPWFYRRLFYKEQ